MNLHKLLLAREAAGKPLRVGLIGAGKFGSMYLSQALRTPGIALVGVADLAPDRARQAMANVGWPAARLEAGSFAKAAAAGSVRITDDLLAEKRLEFSVVGLP